MRCLTILTCPVCATGFEQIDKTLTCEHGHTFDVAREGYVNLLKKKLSGDTREMLTARRSFFAHGYYAPLADALTRLLHAYLPPGQPRILDAGCGEGYYLGHMLHYLSNQPGYEQSCALGLDVSKDAVKMAAKKYPAASFVVANLKERLSIADSSVEAILNVFAPRNMDEFARILSARGLLLIVIPGSEHLQQLRSVLPLLQIEEHKQRHVLEQAAAHFHLLTTSGLSYTLQLAREEIAQLVTMTPNYWHLSDEARQSLETLPEMAITVSFLCLLLQKI
ncbi:methyltransferase domain-containing protein [Ktedonosporobacter rubrisoli]|uniref:Methyltransferase domain-containing protein n=1 Tax=Ktedonosporobacter rubrisoli TaxID=2509675 RepID=A0A4P6JZU6_KTERU|nr:methyltransferase domain-containing protein [Ktedonosporobacter rubrisoli]QBD80656.1 methyltransferase domain-containing protein [Ktedonosporobacter rubrisoli]